MNLVNEIKAVYKTKFQFGIEGEVDQEIFNEIAALLEDLIEPLQTVLSELLAEEATSIRGSHGSRVASVSVTMTEKIIKEV